MLGVRPGVDDAVWRQFGLLDHILGVVVGHKYSCGLWRLGKRFKPKLRKGKKAGIF